MFCHEFAIEELYSFFSLNKQMLVESNKHRKLQQKIENYLIEKQELDLKKPAKNDIIFQASNKINYNL